MSNKKLSVIIGAIDKLSPTVKKINGVINRMSAPFDKINRKVNKLKNNAGLKKFNRQLKSSIRHAKNAGRAIGKMAKVAGAVAVIGGGAILGLGKAYADAGDDIAKTSHRLGIGVRALQEYRFAADRSGVASATFDMALQRFGRRTAEAANGTGEAKGALKALDIQLKDTSGNMRSTESLLGDALAQLGKVKDPLTRNALAMKLFDSEGVKMVQMTQQGAEGIEKLRKEARDLGLVMSEDAAKAAEVFTDKSTNLAAVITGLRNRIGEQLLPVLNPLIDRLVELGKEYGPVVSKWAEGFAKDLPTRLESLWSGVQKVAGMLAGLGSMMMWLSDSAGVIDTVLTALAVVIGFQVVAAVVSLMVSLKALGVAIALTPIGWFIGIVAALIAVGVLLYKNWDSITAVFKKFGNFLMESSPIALLISGVQELLTSSDGVMSFFGNLFSFLAKNNPFSLMLRSTSELIKMFTGFDVLSSVSEKLQNLLPDWALKLLSLGDGGGSAESIRSTSIKSAIPVARAQVGGDLRIKIDSEGRARVNELKSDNPNVGVVVDVGHAMAGA